MTLGELSLPQGARHETDMIAPSLAMAHCGMDCTLVTDQQWRSDVWTWHEEPPPNTVVHYGWDFIAYPHLKSTFNKFIYNDSPPWSDYEKLQQEIESTPYNWIKHFLSDILSLKKIDIDRRTDRAAAVPTV